MSGGGSQSSLRKTIGAIKDTTTVSLAKINSEYKELDIAIVKATNHVECPAKEKYVKAIFAAISANRPRADVAYCIHALSRRLSKTRNWAVALKTLIVIHRALREVDPTFHEEVINYGRSRGHILNMAHFKDDSSPNAWDYSAWVRTYALFLEERLECFRALKYDIATDRLRTKDLDTPDLLMHLPALQQLLFRVLGCQPHGAAVRNYVIQLALSMVASESIKIYNAISDGTINLVDKFFEMQRYDAVKALDIYRRAGQQAERLSEFYDICRGLDLRRGERFPRIEQPPASFLQAMEEYVREAPRASAVHKDLSVVEEPKVIVAIEYTKTPEAEEARRPSSLPPTELKTEPEPVKVEAPVAELPDLLSLDDPVPVVTEIDEKNAMALAIVPVVVGAPNQPSSTSPNLENGTSGWELALVATPSSTEGAPTAAKLAGGLDKLALNSLYDDAIRRNNQPASYNPWESAPMSTSVISQAAALDPFYASTMVGATPSLQMAAVANQQQVLQMAAVANQQQALQMAAVANHQQQALQMAAVANQQQALQMAAMANQQQALMWQQQQQMMMMGSQQPPSANPFSNPFGATVHPYGTGMPVQPFNNPYATGLM